MSQKNQRQKTSTNFSTSKQKFDVNIENVSRLILLLDRLQFHTWGLLIPGHLKFEIWIKNETKTETKRQTSGQQFSGVQPGTCGRRRPFFLSIWILFKREVLGSLAVRMEFKSFDSGLFSTHFRYVLLPCCFSLIFSLSLFFVWFLFRCAFGRGLCFSPTAPPQQFVCVCVCVWA